MQLCQGCHGLPVRVSAIAVVIYSEEGTFQPEVIDQDQVDQPHELLQLNFHENIHLMRLIWDLLIGAKNGSTCSDWLHANTAAL